MRRFIEILTVLAALSAQAFDSRAWLEKRDRFAAEAQRLRAAYTNCVAHLQVPADDVTVPIESFEDGSIKAVVHARKAQYFHDIGLVWAEDVTVKKFKKDGSVDAMIAAAHCVVDRFSKSGWAEGPATVVQGKTTFNGDGVFFSSPDGYVKVASGAKVVSTDLKLGGVRQ